jgi:hypothetical protein
MRIIVCGDSFMTRAIRTPGKHFSELLDPHEVINLARGGISNIGICFQLMEASKMFPSIVIVGTTDSGRIEIPNGQGKFLKSNGLKNIVYTQKNSASINSGYAGGSDAPIISDTIPTVIGEETDLIDAYILPDSVRQAVKQYFSFMYHPEVKLLADQWAIGYWIMYLEKQGVKVLLANKILNHLYSAGITNQTDWVFHTSFNDQQEAADIIKKII